MMTADQKKFLRDLLRDLRRLFMTGDKTEADLVAWMGGLLNRHILTAAKGYWAAWPEIEQTIFGLTSDKARRLIGAFIKVRDRLDGKGGRESVQTPKYLLRAIWTTMRAESISEEALREAVKKITNGETESTKHLRHSEAVELATQLGAPTKAHVHKFVKTRKGAKLAR